MGKLTTLLFLLLVLCNGMAITMGFFNDDDWGVELERRGERRRERRGESGSSRLFLMQNSKSVVRTDAGEMRVFRGYGGRSLERRMHIGFINMEPKSLFIPQYLDSNLVMFIRRGEAKLGFIHKDKLSERRLKTGDVYLIPAGSPFYLVNVGEGQRLHIICSIDPSERFGVDTFHSFYIGGGDNAESVLAGFEPEILQSALNASRRDVERIITSPIDGPIVFVDDAHHAPSLWTKFLQMKEVDKVEHMKKMVQEHDEEDQTSNWSWRKLLKNVFGSENKKSDYKGTGDSPDSYNIYDDKKPDFRNAYGHSIALDEDKYPPLRDVGIGVYLVNLTAGSMMAPHVNPRATEYGIVLRGSGTIQIVFPNGTSAMNTDIREGDVFFVPRFFPFCHIASRTGPSLEFFGFTTSSKKNRPQFLAGSSSILRTMMGPELAAGFGLSEETMRRMVDAQGEGVILPSTWAAPGDVDVDEKKRRQRQRQRKREEEEETEDVDVKKTETEAKAKKGIKGFAKDLVMDVVDV